MKKTPGKDTNIVLLDPDVLREFPTSRAVNAALRKLIRAQAARATRASRGFVRGIDTTITRERDRM